MLGTTGDVKEFDVGENLAVSSRVQAVVDYFGPTDFLQMDARRLPNGMIHDRADSPESQLIGGPIQENKEKVARANPIMYVAKNSPPILICHGIETTGASSSKRAARGRPEEGGVPVTFYTSKAGHADSTIRTPR
jgi:hypothetical protein